MGDVVSLNPEPEEPGIWFCSCDSYTFKLRGDGIAVCALCGAEHAGKEDGAWCFPPVEPELKPCPNDPRILVDCGGMEFALRRVLSRIDPEETAAVIVLQESGAAHTWGTVFKTKAQRSWLGRGLRTARSLLQGT